MISLLKEEIFSLQINIFLDFHSETFYLLIDPLQKVILILRDFLLAKFNIVHFLIHCLHPVPRVRWCHAWYGLDEQLSSSVHLNLLTSSSLMGDNWWNCTNVGEKWGGTERYSTLVLWKAEYLCNMGCSYDKGGIIVEYEPMLFKLWILLQYIHHWKHTFTMHKIDQSSLLSAFYHKLCMYIHGTERGSHHMTDDVVCFSPKSWYKTYIVVSERQTKVNENDRMYIQSS